MKLRVIANQRRNDHSVDLGRRVKKRRHTRQQADEPREKRHHHSAISEMCCLFEGPRFFCYLLVTRLPITAPRRLYEAEGTFTSDRLRLCAVCDCLFVCSWRRVRGRQHAHGHHRRRCNLYRSLFLLFRERVLILVCGSHRRPSVDMAPPTKHQQVGRVQRKVARETAEGESRQRVRRNHTALSRGGTSVHIYIGVKFRSSFSGGEVLMMYNCFRFLFLPATITRPQRKSSASGTGKSGKSAFGAVLRPFKDAVSTHNKTRFMEVGHCCLYLRFVPVSESFPS